MVEQWRGRVMMRMENDDGYSLGMLSCRVPSQLEGTYGDE